MEKTSLNRLAHHLQLYKDHFRDSAVHFEECQSCRWPQSVMIWYHQHMLLGNFHQWETRDTYSSHVVRQFVQLLLRVTQSEMAGLSKMRIP